MKRIASLIVNIRYLIFLLIAIALAFSVVSSKWVKVENDLVEYLPETSETRIGQKLMKDQFFTYGSAEVMVANITVEDAEALGEDLRDINGVREVSFDSESTNYYNDVSALYQITFEYSEDDDRCKDALSELRRCTADYDAYIESDVENTFEDTIEREVSVIIMYIAVIVFVALMLTTTSFGEVPVLLITFVVAMLLNNGSNFLLGKISFVSNSVTSILQLALSLDYAIIFCNHYKEEHLNLPIKEAVVEALAKAMPEIGSSCLTTLGGFVAMLFMSFKLGADMGICLMKAVIISILTVFILMPGLLVLFGPLIDKTMHKTIVPNMHVLGKFSYKTRKIVPPIFLVIIVGALLIQRDCPYVFGYGSIVTPKQNDSQIVDKMIEDTFTNPGELAVIVPTGDFEREGLLIREIETFPEVDHVTGLANSEAMDGYMVTDILTPRQFSELLDIDYSSAQLLYTAYAAENDELSKIAGGISNYRIRIMDMLLFVNSQVKDGAVSLDEDEADTLAQAADSIESGKKQLLGEDFSRIIVYLKQDVQNTKAYDCIDKIKSTCQKAYPDGDVHVVGQLTNEYDFKKSFEADNIKVSIISILIVMLVLLVTFKSIAMPVLLIMVIQGSIWINFAIPAITGQPIMFMANLVVSAIQMGANIDYAIVIGSRYMETRPHMDRKDAIAETMRFAFPTIITSGSILAVAGILIGGMTSEATIVGIGQSVGRGTIISIILVLFVLPQILLLGEGLIKHTAVSFKSLIDKDNIKGMLCLLLCTGLVLSTTVTAQAQTVPSVRTEVDTIFIRTEEDLKAFADSCSLDSWSRGRKIELKNDITLVQYRDISVPVFSGRFNGNGCEIKGLDLDAQTSSAGLFCNVMEGGSIYNLKVSGNLRANDDDLSIGGIVGKNGGLIYHCIFEGQLEADSTAGGIAGKNTETGIIRNCKTYGTISAKSVCGGIAGENEGGIFTCTGNCTVDSEASDPGLSIDSINDGMIPELSKITSPESYGITRDIGGICGKTSGRIVNCTNNGRVGADHIGYNIGGIAGRNTGFVSRCVNNGEVFGRKDIGGIVGQAEPYTEITMTADRLEELEAQTNEMNDAASELEQQLDRVSGETQNGISGMIDTIRTINTDTEKLQSDVHKKLDKTSGQLADTMDEADRVNGKMYGVASGLSDAAEGLNSMASGYEKSIERLSEIADMTDDIRKQLKQNARTVTEKAAVISGCVISILETIKDMTGDPGAAIEHIGQYAAEISQASQKIGEALDNVEELLKNIPDVDINLIGALKKSGMDIKKTIAGISDSAGSLKRMSDCADDLIGFDTEISSPEISSSVSYLLSDFDTLNDQADELSTVLTDEKTRTTVKEILGIGQDITDTLTGSVQDIRDSGDFITDGTYEDIADMTDGKICLCSNTGTISGDFNAGGIAGAMSVEKDNDPDDDDMSISDLYRRRYRLKNAVEGCRNSGQITVRKNCGGGICGKQDTGVIIDCGSFGNVSAGEGKYVGGIAGSSSAEIYSCSTKCILEGHKYVGGIIGCGYDEDISYDDSVVENCISMAALPDDAAFTGMISGSDKGCFRRNRFVSGSSAGIGGASYSGRAEPVSYDALIRERSVPEEFKTVNVYFIRNGELIEKREVSYGDSISPEDYPELTSTEEYYGKWINPAEGPICSDVIIMAEDCRYITAVNSNLKRSEDSGRPMFIVEGRYAGDPVFTVEKKEEGEYYLKIPVDGNHSHCVRYDPAGKDVSKLVISYTDGNGAEREADVQKFGRCAKFTVEGNEVTLRIKQ